MRGVRKYRNQPVVVDGIKFDSKREADRWAKLLLLQRGGIISQLERQVSFQLAPGVKLADEKRARPALRYVADFRYYSPGASAFIVEDAKGHQTEVFRIKRHLMKSVHGIDVRLS